MTTQGSNSAAVLKGFLERVERLEEEKKSLQEDIRDVKKEAKAAGFDMTAFNEMLKLRALDAEKRAEREELREMYKNALDLV